MTDRELDAMVAEKVMGWTLHGVAPSGGRVLIAPSGAMGIPNYSTDISAAWQVVEKMRSKRIHFEMGSTIPGDWTAYFNNDRATDKSAPRAICLAALKAVGVEAPR